MAKTSTVQRNKNRTRLNKSLTPKRAKEARRFIDVFGFKREGVVRRGFGDDDAIVGEIDPFAP